MPTLLWFRRDLRLHDLPALLDAAKDDREVLACYVLDPRLKASSGPRRLQYLYDSLRELRDGLDGRLLVTAGPGRDRESPPWSKKIDATSVHVSADYSPFGMRRDDAVREALRSTVPLEESGSPYLVSPGRVTKGDGTPYKVFTPFYSAWREHGWRAPARDRARRSARWIDPADVGRRRRHPRRRRRTGPSRPVRPRRARRGRRSSTRRWPTTPTTATGRITTAPAGCRRTSSSAPSIRARWPPTSAAARAPRPICASWRSATSTPASCYAWPDSTWWNWNKAFDRIEVDEDADAKKRFEAWKAGRTGLPDRRRRHAAARRDRLHAQPGADDHRVVPGQGSASAVAVGRALVPRAAGRRRHGQQSARLAVGGGLRHRRRAVLPGVQPDDPGQQVRSRRRLRQALGARVRRRRLPRADGRPRRRTHRGAAAIRGRSAEYDPSQVVVCQNERS